MTQEQFIQAFIDNKIVAGFLNNNLSIRDEKLYSYAEPIAERFYDLKTNVVDTIYLIEPDRNSKTTTKHMNTLLKLVDRKFKQERPGKMVRIKHQSPPVE